MKTQENARKSHLSRDFHQQRVLNMLSDGKPYTIAEISAALKLSDPRGVIRNLRKKGWLICDTWHKAVYGTRYKRYFLKRV